MSIYITDIYSILPEKEIVTEVSDKTVKVNKSDDLDIKEYCDKKGLKRLPKSIQNAVITSINIYNNIQNIDKNKIGIFVGNVMSYIENTDTFLIPAHEKSAKFVSPMAFPNTVLNSISGWISIVLGTTNINTTICTGKTTGLDTIKVACDYIENGIIDKAIVVTTEEITDIVIQADLEASSKYSEGSVALLLEKDSNTYICKIEDIYSSNISMEKYFERLENILKDDKNNVIYGSENSIDCEINKIINFKPNKMINTYKEYGEGFSLNTFFKLIEFLKNDITNCIILESNDIGNKSYMRLSKRKGK